MELIKDISLEAIKKMPDDSSIEDIMYRLNLVSKVMEGIKDADEGRLISSDDLLMKVDEWVLSASRQEQKRI